MINIIIASVTMLGMVSVGDDSNAESNISTACDGICLGFPHPTLGGMVFYLNGEGGGLMVNDSDLLNDQFDDLSMFRWAEPEHLRTPTGLGYFNFDDWSTTSAHSDQQIIDVYGASGNYAALAIRQQLGPDWRLPTATEAYYIDLNLNKNDLGNFADGHYWTSSEVSYNEADITPPNVVAIDMTNGELSTKMAKVQALKVRAVRSF